MTLPIDAPFGGFLLCMLTVLLALALDRKFSEPEPHPLVWFGAAANRLENRANRPGTLVGGGLAVLLLVAPIAAVIWMVSRALAESLVLTLLFDTLVLWFVIGWQSMKAHAVAVAAPLEDKDLHLARQQVARIISRDAVNMNEEQISIAATESVIENGNDCLFGSLFWFAVAGPAGAIVHRLVNTLDAMWGYRTPRFDRFGRIAARLDDALAFVPARLTALCYALAGKTSEAIRCWRRQSRLHASPNAGVVMAAGAGAMGVRLGGAASYHGVTRRKPQLGTGLAPNAGTIPNALSLVERGLVIALTGSLLGAVLWAAVGAN